MRNESHSGITNAEGNRKVIECRQAHPDWSWQKIGDRFGVTRQCACAIYKRAGRRNEIQ